MISLLWTIALFILATITIYISDKSEKPVKWVAKTSEKYIENAGESLYSKYKMALDKFIAYCCLPIESCYKGGKLGAAKFTKVFLMDEQDFFTAYLEPGELKKYEWWQRFFAFVMSPMFVYIILPLIAIGFIVLVIYVILIVRIYLHM